MLADTFKKTSVIIGIVFLALLAVVLLVTRKGENVQQKGENQNAASSSESSQATREPAPSGVVVPEQGATGVSENVAVPLLTMPSAPRASTQFRKFALRAEGGKFSPDTIIANTGDVIRMNISAIDGDYDFIQPDYGIKASITKGNTGVVEFSPWIDGKYMFFCEQCGGMPGQGKGYIIVASK